MPFRFSPRPNTAHRIPWRPFGPEALAEARAAGRPVLLAISASWCHWCHVMDETTYSDPEVQEAIRETVVPVRVDADERPDVDRRYNLGGWPTTAFLTPDGEILTGGTYLPPADMLAALDTVANHVRTHPEALTAARPPTPLPEDDGWGVADVERAAVDAFDAEHGGFGRAPKFPQPDLLLFLLRRTEAGAADHAGLLAQTLAAMAAGEIWDGAEGGFFRYATRRDWSSPHYEKMLEDNARLLLVYARASRLLCDERLADVALRIHAYLEGALRQGDLFGGSQDADEAYYRADPVGRRARPAPAVDGTPYAHANAILARSLIEAGAALGRDGWLAEGVALFQALERTLWREGHLWHTPDGPLVDDLLDLAEFGLAAATAAVAGHAEAEAAFRRAAAEVALRYDGEVLRDVVGEPVGRLSVPDPDPNLQGRACLLLLAVHAATGDEAARATARTVLRRTASLARRYGFLAARWAEAAWVAGDGALGFAFGAGAEPALRRVALARPEPLKVVTGTEAPAGHAVVCRGTACSRPVAEPEALAEVFKA